MTNEDKQTAVPSSEQESLSTLEEQALETITGGGLLSRIFGSSKAVAPKAGGIGSANVSHLNNLYEQAGITDKRYQLGSDGYYYQGK